MAQPSHRTTWIAAVVAAPAIAAAVALTAIEGYRLIEPDAPLFGGPPPATLADAITSNAGVERVYQFIRVGQDPNALIRIDDRDYTRGSTVMASPLMLAVAAEDSSTVVMLFSFGARLDLPQNRGVECLAQELKNREILDIIRAQRGAAALPECSGRRRDEPDPFLAWVD